MEYELASSTTEEGEIKETWFPFEKSYLNNLYYPNTTHFVGINSIPRSLDFISESLTQKLNKKLKNVYGIHLDDTKLRCLLEKNKYKLIMSGLSDKRFNLSLEDVVYGVNVLDFINKYKKGIVIEDRILSYLSKKDSIVIFKVTEDVIFEKVKRIKNLDTIPNIKDNNSWGENDEKKDDTVVRKISFVDGFINGTNFYENMNVDFKFNETEVRIFSNPSNIFSDCNVIVYSTSIHRDSNTLKRVYGNIDVNCNALLLPEIDSARLVDFRGYKCHLYEYFANTKLGEGEYLIYNSCLYKKDCNGVSIGYNEPDYSDFIKNL